MVADIKEEVNKALELHQSGSLDEAEKLYAAILAKNPDNANVLNLLGLLKLQKGQFEDAVYNLNKALNLNPCAYLYGNLGRAYSEYSKFDEAIKCYQKVLELSPEDFDAWFNLALIYKKNMELDKSIEAYKKAIAISPDCSEAYFNLANIYESRNETFLAVENYQKAYDYNTSDKDQEIRYFLGLSRLKIKDFERGIEHYEHRLSKDFAILSQVKLYKEEMTSKPFWMGEDIKDKTLFVYYESGLGDTLMYARYLDLVKDKCAKLLFTPQVCFTELFKENNFGAQIIESMTLPQDVKFDTHVSVMSIPYVLGLHTADIPLSEGYLKANVEKVQDYKQKYFDNDKFKIGIKWQGNTAYDLERIITIESFYKLFDLPNTQFYSVQKDDGSEKLNEIPSKYNIVDLGSTFKDFSDTAAAIENLDLVICNDTSVAHLAGAMGKPCWILLPFVQNWRWHTDLSYSPWYKSVKLFKQSEPDNWDEVFVRVSEELKKEINV